LEGQAAACTTHDVLYELSKIQNPALIIGGAADIFTPAWMAEEVAGAILTLNFISMKGAAMRFIGRK
jgi:pimeloyl-ACP methyl ester carboxylesterase